MPGPLSSFTLIAALKGILLLCLFFTDKETEAQGVKCLARVHAASGPGIQTQASGSRISALRLSYTRVPDSSAALYAPPGACAQEDMWVRNAQEKPGLRTDPSS